MNSHTRKILHLLLECGLHVSLVHSLHLTIMIRRSRLFPGEGCRDDAILLCVHLRVVLTLEFPENKMLMDDNSFETSCSKNSNPNIKFKLIGFYKGT